MERSIDHCLGDILPKDLVDIVKEYTLQPMKLIVVVNNRNTFFNIKYLDTYNIRVNWGDGGDFDTQLIDEQDLEMSRHRYISPGTYRIEVYGDSEHLLIDFNNILISVLDYGTFRPSWISFRNSFSLRNIPNYVPESVTSLRQMLSDCVMFNSPVRLNLPNVRNCSGMFSGCKKFNSPVDLNSPVLEDCSYMFLTCSVLDSAVKITTSNVTTMFDMFMDCQNFNQQLDFDTRKVTNFQQMFYRCSSLKMALPLSVRKDANTTFMFNGSQGRLRS